MLGGSFSWVGVVAGFGTKESFGGGVLIPALRRLRAMLTFPLVFADPFSWDFESKPVFLVTTFAITGVLVTFTDLFFIGVTRVVMR